MHLARDEQMAFLVILNNDSDVARSCAIHVTDGTDQKRESTSLICA